MGVRYHGPSAQADCVSGGALASSMAIAAELELSEMTVKVHRGQVMRKMQAGSLAKLVRIADRLTALTTAS
jgi:FixJ family two-component response regulator